MNQSTERKARETKPKIFGTFLIDDDGREQLIAYTEHYSKPQAQAAVLADRVVTRLADHNDLIAIGRDGTEVQYLHADFEDDQADAFREGGNQ